MVSISRIGAFLIDHIIGSFITVILAFVINWDSFFHPTESNFKKHFETFNILLALGMIYYLSKDIYKGRSIGKKVVGLVVRDINNSDAIPGIPRLIIRNITIFIWPIEILLLIFTQRKIGDRLTRTQVIRFF